MKYFIIALTLTFILTSCGSEPTQNCFDSNCEVGACSGDQCECMLEDYAILDMHVKCINCPSNMTNLYVEFILDDNKIADLDLRKISDFSVSTAKTIYGTGQLPYILKSGTVILESGNINIVQCKRTSFNSNVSI